MPPQRSALDRPPPRPLVLVTQGALLVAIAATLVSMSQSTTMRRDAWFFPTLCALMWTLLLSDNN